MLDLVVDYLTYVFIPAYALIYSGLIPWPWSLVAAIFIALTGVVYFADVRMKAEDNCFVGFPAVWQMPLLVFLTFQPPVWVTAASIVLLGVAQFTWLKFIHPVRTERWRRVNLSICLALGGPGRLVGVGELRPAAPVKAGLLASSVWLLVVGVVMQVFPVRTVAAGVEEAAVSPAGSAPAAEIYAKRGALSGRHSGARSPKARSQRAQTWAWGWVPTSGRIFQQRAHLSPSASAGTTATPGTSSRVKAPAGAGAAVRVRSEVMQTSAKSTEASAARRASSATWTTGAASRLAPMRFSRRSTSSAPVTTRRTRRIASHLAARAASCQSRGVGRKSSRCTELSSPGKRVEPDFLHGEGEHGGEPGDEAVEEGVEHGAGGAAARAGRGVAVEGVLADVEVEAPRGRRWQNWKRVWKTRWKS